VQSVELDRYLPDPHEEKRHRREVAAPPGAVWDALIDLDLADSLIIRGLMTARGIVRPSLRWADLERVGFLRLHEDAPHELLLGVIAQPWRITGGIVSADPGAFRRFDVPGYAVIGWTHVLEPTAGGTNVTTVTRIRCTDDESLRRFRLYWRAIGPFSGVIRTQGLRLLARSVHRRLG
jgi:hypothetical protein